MGPNDIVYQDCDACGAEHIRMERAPYPFFCGRLCRAIHEEWMKSQDPPIVEKQERSG